MSLRFLISIPLLAMLSLSAGCLTPRYHVLDPEAAVLIDHVDVQLLTPQPPLQAVPDSNANAWDFGGGALGWIIADSLTFDGDFEYADDATFDLSALLNTYLAEQNRFRHTFDLGQIQFGTIADEYLVDFFDMYPRSGEEAVQEIVPHTPFGDAPATLHITVAPYVIGDGDYLLTFVSLVVTPNGTHPELDEMLSHKSGALHHTVLFSRSPRLSEAISPDDLIDGSFDQDYSQLHDLIIETLDTALRLLALEIRVGRHLRIAEVEQYLSRMDGMESVVYTQALTSMMILRTEPTTP